MADGSSDDCTGPQQMNDLTFSAPDTGHGNTKKCSGETLEGERVKLSFYTELETSESCEKSESRGVAADRPAAPDSAGSRNPCETNATEGEDRKKRCFDRYDSSESSDSGVAVLSPTESGYSGSDITSPASPRSPESGLSAGDASDASEGSAPARMPPAAAPPAPRRAPAAPPPAPRARRRLPPPLHRRITEFFNHKMKPQLAKREALPYVDDAKRRCLPRNGVAHDFEEYISYLSQTFSPMLDANTQAAAPRKAPAAPAPRPADKPAPTVNGMIDLSKPKEGKEKTPYVNGFVEVRPTESIRNEKPSPVHMNGVADHKKRGPETKTGQDPSANELMKNKRLIAELSRKVPLPAPAELATPRLAPAPAAAASQPPKKLTVAKQDAAKMNGVVSSTTKLDSRMNGVTCGSNNISLNAITCKPNKKETAKKTQTQAPKRTNRKSSACIANNKNLTWSKANNLKQQVQLQKQNCVNTAQQLGSPAKSVPEASTAPQMNIPNGVRQVSMTVNGSLGNLNMPVNSQPNYHPLNIPQPCNGNTVTSNNLPSFVAVPQNVMLTTLRIPQNGMQPQTINQQNNLNAFNRSNVNVSNVSSPTKLNGQFVFSPFVQNINGTVVQIPNLMAKMPNFVLPQTPQLGAQRQDHLQNLQNQQAAQILINGTLLKLANTMTSSYPNLSNMNKSVTATSQSIPVLNKNVPGMPTMGMTVQPKPNYTVNLSHSVLVPQPGFIVTSVPNINVKETWSYSGTHCAAPNVSSCSNPTVQHPPPIVNNYSTQALHASSIPIAPVKPPDNPIQGTDPPSSTVKEPEVSEAASQNVPRPVPSPKTEVPWLSKTVNNNIVPFDLKLPPRAFAQVSNLTSKLEEKEEIIVDDKVLAEEKRNAEEIRKENIDEGLRKVEEVARREETIFTQITVLKDVSSNVQSTVIEANYCSATTESSESGIGTDKSIDSPSDSQTSKECDEDSSLSLSLSVSVCEEAVCASQKSPILKQPKTLRFPPLKPVKPPGGKRTSSTDTTTIVLCMWENCKGEFDSDADLLEHLQSVHVESQAGKENYVCLWQACKVRGKPSCSRLWLERHALSHGGNKPFKCIVDGCERRFSTQILLERHVNNHFTEASPNGSGSKKTADGSGAKLIRRNGKKLRYRRQPWSARMFDFFDAGTMEGLAWRLARATRWRLGGACPLREPAGRHVLTLTAALAATRTAPRGGTEALLTYYPPNVIEDEWVPEKDVKRVKRVEIASLPAATKVLLSEQLAASYRAAPSPPPPPRAPPPARTLPPRHCTSSRLLNNLLTKKKEARSDCNATNVPMILEEEIKVEVSGAKKRKMGRRHGGNAFWPCGR